jgi:hypothetical protein
MIQEAHHTEHARHNTQIKSFSMASCIFTIKISESMTKLNNERTQGIIEDNMSEGKQYNEYLELLYLGFQLASLICCDRTGNNRSGDSTSSAKSLF